MTAIKFINIKEVCSMTGLGKSTVYKLIDARLFPAQVKLTATASRWPEEAVIQWMDDRMVEAGYSEGVAA